MIISKKEKKKKNPENETEMITIPRAWFEGLLKLAQDYDILSKSYEFKKSNINDSVFLKGSTLCGYALSSKCIIKDNIKTPNNDNK